MSIAPLHDVLRELGYRLRPHADRTLLTASNALARKCIKSPSCLLPSPALPFVVPLVMVVSTSPLLGKLLRHRVPLFILMKMSLTMVTLFGRRSHYLPEVPLSPGAAFGPKADLQTDNAPPLDSSLRKDRAPEQECCLHYVASAAPATCAEPSAQADFSWLREMPDGFGKDDLPHQSVDQQTLPRGQLQTQLPYPQEVLQGHSSGAFAIHEGPFWIEGQELGGPRG